MVKNMIPKYPINYFSLQSDTHSYFTKGNYEFDLRVWWATSIHYHHFDCFDLVNIHVW